MVERSRRASGGTLGACLAALEEGFAANLAGGTHHAFSDRGEGYCVFNDSAIAARAVQAAGLVERVVVIDTDVHQGNGTAAILRRDPTVFTFSIHGAKNFPFHKEESDLDAPLPDGAGRHRVPGDARKWPGGGARRRGRRPRHLPRRRRPVRGRPPRPALRNKAGLAERDRIVLETCRERGIPVAVTMAGGYASEVEDTVDIHFQSIRRAADLMESDAAATVKETLLT